MPSSRRSSFEACRRPPRRGRPPRERRRSRAAAVSSVRRSRCSGGGARRSAGIADWRDFRRAPRPRAAAATASSGPGGAPRRPPWRGQLLGLRRSPSDVLLAGQTAARARAARARAPAARRGARIPAPGGGCAANRSDCGRAPSSSAANGGPRLGLRGAHGDAGVPRRRGPRLGRLAARQALACRSACAGSGVRLRQPARPAAASTCACASRSARPASQSARSRAAARRPGAPARRAPSRRRAPRRRRSIALACSRASAAVAASASARTSAVLVPRRTLHGAVARRPAARRRRPVRARHGVPHRALAMPSARSSAGGGPAARPPPRRSAGCRRAGREVGRVPRRRHAGSGEVALRQQDDLAELLAAHAEQLGDLLADLLVGTAKVLQTPSSSCARERLWAFSTVVPGRPRFSGRSRAAAGSLQSASGDGEVEGDLGTGAGGGVVTAQGQARPFCRAPGTEPYRA